MQKFVTRAISIARHNSVTYVCARVMKIGLYDRGYITIAQLVLSFLNQWILSLSLSLYLSIEYLENFFRSVFRYRSLRSPCRSIIASLALIALCQS